MKPHERLFVALDTPDAGWARGVATRLRGHVGGFKVGLELFTSAGPDLVLEIRDTGASVFLDLKLHDIPNTVAGAASAIARLGVTYFTVHAGGGPRMIRRGVEAAEQAAREAGHPAPTVLAVTVLTSHDDAELEQIGLAGPCPAAVLRLATLAREAGAGGLVCSPLEVAELRSRLAGATLVVPGIRPAGLSTAGDDQSRVATPGQAVAAGADLLVIGRPITRSEDPVGAAQRIAEDIERSRATR